MACAGRRSLFRGMFFPWSLFCAGSRFRGTLAFLVRRWIITPGGGRSAWVYRFGLLFWSVAVWWPGCGSPAGGDDPTGTVPRRVSQGRISGRRRHSLGAFMPAIGGHFVHFSPFGGAGNYETGPPSGQNLAFSLTWERFEYLRIHHRVAADIGIFNHLTNRFFSLNEFRSNFPLFQI